MRQIKPYAWSALNLCNTRFVHQYAVRGRRHVFDAEGSITNLIFCSPLSTATRGAKMHKPLAQALVIIAAAAVASDEPSSGRRLAARRGRRRQDVYLADAFEGTQCEATSCGVTQGSCPP